MPEGTLVERLHLRKQTLLLESDLNRLEVRREIEVLRDRFAWLQNPVGAALEKSPLFLMLPPVAGVLFSRLLRSRSPWTSKVAVLASCLRFGWPLWRRFAAGFARRRDGTD